MTSDAGVRTFGMRVFFFFDGLLLFSLGYLIAWPNLQTDEPAGWILPVGAVAAMFGAAFHHGRAARKKAGTGVGVAAVGPFLGALLLILNITGERIQGPYAVAVYVPTVVLAVHLAVTSLALVIAYFSGSRAAHQTPQLGSLLVFMTGASAFIVSSIFVF